MAAAAEFRELIAREQPEWYQELLQHPLPPDWAPNAEETKRFLNVATRNECRTCHATEPANMKSCDACKLARYCSVECQRLDWTDHKRFCDVERCVKGMMKEQLYGGHVDQ
jgi:hypothetical protein